MKTIRWHAIVVKHKLITGKPTGFSVYAVAGAIILAIQAGYIEANDWLNLIFRVGLSVVIGGLIGFERQWTGTNRSAGVRTHMVISLGATLFILLPIQLPQDYSSVNALSRTIQGIATGVGFIGAGLILQQSHRGKVKGLTSAAAIWATAALGTAIGLGYWQLAVVGTVAMLLVLSGVKQAKRPIAVRLGRSSSSSKKRSADAPSPTPTDRRAHPSFFSQDD
ncbi:MgtC/SapB family protein [Leptolyngbya subtilissima]|uniref:MgtC/SapB family protein n=1 Tax=Leptolyngbya subtilissima TaxID=1346803 RepID=UPI003297FE0B